MPFERPWYKRLAWGATACLSVTTGACSTNESAVARLVGRGAPSEIPPAFAESTPAASGKSDPAGVPGSRSREEDRGSGRDASATPTPAAFDKGAKDEKQPAPAAPAEKISLPAAVQLCLFTNLRLQASAERISQAEADLLTESLIPNPSLFVDAQLIPLQTA